MCRVRRRGWESISFSHSPWPFQAAALICQGPGNSSIHLVGLVRRHSELQPATCSAQAGLQERPGDEQVAVVVPLNFSEAQ